MGSQTKKFIKTLFRYICDVAVTTGVTEFNKTEWHLVKCNIEETPQQNNSYDCGLFVIMYADFILHDIPITYFNQSHMEYFRKKVCLNICKGEIQYNN